MFSVQVGFYFSSFFCITAPLMLFHHIFLTNVFHCVDNLFGQSYIIAKGICKCRCMFHFMCVKVIDMTVMQVYIMMVYNVLLVIGLD